MDTFAQWYDHEHRHTGIGLHTPADVYYGLAYAKAADRSAILTDARARHPYRFGTTHTPKILDLPDTVWIRRPRPPRRRQQHSALQQQQPTPTPANHDPL